ACGPPFYLASEKTGAGGLSQYLPLRRAVGPRLKHPALSGSGLPHRKSWMLVPAPGCNCPLRDRVLPKVLRVLVLVLRRRCGPLLHQERLPIPLSPGGDRLSLLILRAGLPLGGRGSTTTPVWLKY